MKQLSALDAMFAYFDTNKSPMHIGQLLIYDPSTAPGGAVGFKDILRYMKGRLDGARIFRQKLVRVPLDFDHPYWIEDNNFDLEYHVRHIALPQPGDWRQLCIQAARIYARPLDMDRPLWEFTVIEGLDNVEGLPKGCFAVLHKLHHAAIDGQSGLQMSLALHDMDAKMKPRDFDMNWQPENPPSNLSLLMKAQVNNITNPVRGMQNLQKLWAVPKRLMDANRQHNGSNQYELAVPKTRFSNRVGPHRVFDGRTFALGDIKTIRSAFPGATVNDVMLAVVGGSMRHFLNKEGELPKRSLKVGAPVSVRSEDEKTSAGNQVTMMTVGIGTHISDAAKRLEYVVKETARSKAMTEAMGARTLMDLSGAMPAGLIAAGTKFAMRIGLNPSLPQMNSIVTNVPGPPVKMYFAGAELKQSYGMGLVSDGVGLFHVVTSYNGNLMLTFLADRDMLPNPADYADNMAESFSRLLAAANKRLKAAKTKKTTGSKAKKRRLPASQTAGKAKKK